ncbi:hypothetical protein PsorP6_002417 [Peronosclerospora sorghi]|uniref:Uncharacterized protein n=1 Tax=Peronosclerospora sorghi TaxID=230839 RepID=A0ACC0WTW1_9STRA|nr:hypothetical protein PsorP6_002417 [Peronosclerospora sorghi]
MFIFRSKLSGAASMLEFEGFCDDQAEHVSAYKALRQEYRDDREQSMRGGPAAVFAFDYSQNVPIPHSTQQPGRWYYMSLPNFHHFKFADEG